ncbi:transposase [Roseovarius sp. D22-M7]
MVHGLAVPAEIAAADGAMEFWKALKEVFPGTRHQRCWIHKIANVLNRFAKSMQPAVKADLRGIWQAGTRGPAETAMDIFSEKCGTKYENAVTCLAKEKEPSLPFYDFPAYPALSGPRA